MSKYLRALFFLLILLIAAHTSRAQRPVRIQTLLSQEAYQSMAGDPVSDKYGSVLSLKVVMQLRNQKVDFIPSKTYKYHYDYCRDYLNLIHDHYSFNTFNYSPNPNRQYCLGNVNFYPDMGKWTLEISTADDMPAELIAPFQSAVSKAAPFIDTLFFFVNTASLEPKVRQPINAKLPVIFADQIYGAQQYQAIHKSTGYGYLRIMTRAQVAETPPTTRDIVILTEDVLDIPPVAGLITTQFQTPLSHLVLLCKNRGTAFACDKRILQYPQVKALENKLVKLTVVQDSLTIEPTVLTEAAMVWKQKKPATIPLKKDLSVQHLIPAADLALSMVPVVGGKAANLGELYRLAQKTKRAWKVPESAFAIPFYFYQKHLEKSGAEHLIDILVKRESSGEPEPEIRDCLREIQKKIRDTPVDSALLTSIDSMAKALGNYPRLRFRSSTNAEDIQGFNGAGLYTSKSADVADAEAMQKAITRVWASAWDFEAYQERAYFGISQLDVAMGVLVHRNFPDEKANGVAITANLYRQNYSGFVINVQTGDLSVVSPEPGVVCDQLICYQASSLDFFKEKEIIEYITHSNQVPAGQHVLTDEQVLRLTEILGEIKDYYFKQAFKKDKKLIYNNYALDIEFKFMGDEGQIYIKQVRPFGQ